MELSLSNDGRVQWAKDLGGPVARLIAKDVRQDHGHIQGIVTIAIDDGLAATSELKLLDDSARNRLCISAVRSLVWRPIIKSYSLQELKLDLDLFCTELTEQTGIADKTDICELLTNTDICQSDGVEQKIDAHVWPEVEKWLVYHKGERFDLDMICRQLDMKTSKGRHSVAKKLAYLVHHEKLEKNDRLYTIINKEYTLVNWVDADVSRTIPLKWPYGVDDESSFGFDGCAIISPGDVIVLAGMSNSGKSAFCLNLLWENMDMMPCTLMGNEYTPIKFKRRVGRMNWRNPLREDRTPKFELIERRDRWKDIIRPDNINIIDWIDLGENFYQIGTIIQGIQAQLRNGIVVISIQKHEGKTLGLGGGFSEALASLYLLVDFGRITVRKCKEWFEHDPNREMYGFDIVQGGSRFARIRPVKICYTCGGQGRTFKGKCEACLGLGHLDIGVI